MTLLLPYVNQNPCKSWQILVHTIHMYLASNRDKKKKKPLKSGL